MSAVTFSTGTGGTLAGEACMLTYFYSHKILYNAHFSCNFTYYSVCMELLLVLVTTLHKS